MKISDDDRILHPLRLSAGSFFEGSGRGCAMNVISYENGDSKITDFPKCSDRMLSRLVQIVNDNLAGPDGYLTAEDSIKVLELAHATVGTSSHNLSNNDLKLVYVRIAVIQARNVLHLNDDPRVLNSILAAENYISNPTYASAASAAAASAAAYGSSVEFVSDIIKLFKELTVIESQAVPVEKINSAITKMLTKA